MKSRTRKALRIAGGLLLAAGLGLGIFVFAMSARLPEGGPAGPEADALAHRLEEAMDLRAWEATGAVEWTHAQRSTHLWDRQRGFDRVRFKDAEVLLDTWSGDGLAFANGTEAAGAEKARLIKKAYGSWVNDAFWLVPLSKLFDPGVIRRKVQLPPGEGSDVGLLVQYERGGVTPGDAYLWPVPKDGLPSSWRMWVSIVPVKGARVSWDGWRALSTGVKVSTHHELLGLVKFDLTDLRAAHTLAELTNGEEPFSRLAELRARR